MGMYVCTYVKQITQYGYCSCAVVTLLLDVPFTPVTFIHSNLFAIFERFALLIKSLHDYLTFQLSTAVR